MNIKSFFARAISAALELKLATSEDVLHHVTPDVLATHLPRPLWAKLIAACLAAPRLDATLIVDTITVPNLCEHIPLTILWACISEIGTRSLAGTSTPRVAVPLSPPPPAIAAKPITAAPPVASMTPTTTPAGAAAKLTVSTGKPAALIVADPPTPSGPTPPDAPLAALVAELEAEDRAAPAAALRPRTPTRPPFRQQPTGIGRLAGQKRPQAAASAEAPASSSSAPSVSTETAADRAAAAARRRGQTEESSFELETDVRREAILPVDDEQLVDWSASEETAIGPDYDRKR